jgi:hypothetical protein
MPRILFVTRALAMFSTKFPSLSLPERKLTVLPTVTVPEMGIAPLFLKPWLISSPITTKSFSVARLALTVPEIAGREPIVTELPMVTEAIDIG